MAQSDSMVKTLEPDKCEGWFWKSWEEVKALNAAVQGEPQRLFLPIIHLLSDHLDVEALFR